MRALLGAFTSVVLIAASVAVGASPSEGNWYEKTGLTGCYGNQADNKTHTIGYNNLSQMTAWNHAWVEDNRIDGVTAVTPVYKSTIDSNTDLVALDAYYTGYCGVLWYNQGGGVIGATSCYSLHNEECQKHQARYDQAFMDQAANWEAQYLIVHETGHSFGLDHRNDDVMQSGAMLYGYYSTHDKGHLANDLDN